MGLEDRKHSLNQNNNSSYNSSLNNKIFVTNNNNQKEPLGLILSIIGRHILFKQYTYVFSK
jgi:hypothetical protein